MAVVSMKAVMPPSHKSPRSFSRSLVMSIERQPSRRSVDLPCEDNDHQDHSARPLRPAQFAQIHVSVWDAKSRDY